MIMESERNRFFSKIDKTNSCWNWIGSIQNDGYSAFWLHGKSISAHRLSYELFIGKIPNDMVIDHLCRNRKCVNPKHLECVTQRINLLRGNTIQSENAMKTECKNGHPLSDNNLDKSQLRHGHRVCKICLNEYRRLKRYNDKNQ